MDSGFRDTQQVEATIGKVLLIDLENCPNQLHHLPSDLANYLQVVICYAQSSSKVPLNWLTPLSTAISANKLKIVKMERVGKNSADFGICFFAGALMQELPKETHFVIVSNDTDLDHTVYLLKSHGRSSERVGSQSEEKELQPIQVVQAPTPSSPVSGPLNIYCNDLVKNITNRPAKTETLISGIRHKFKDNPSFPDVVYKLLISSGAVKVTANKVAYNDSKIRELAKNV